MFLFFFLLTIQTDFSVVYIPSSVEINTLRVHYTWDYMLSTPVGAPSHIAPPPPSPSNPYDTMTAAAAFSLLPADGDLNLRGRLLRLEILNWDGVEGISLIV